MVKKLGIILSTIGALTLYACKDHIKPEPAAEPTRADCELLCDVVDYPPAISVGEIPMVPVTTVTKHEGAMLKNCEPSCKEYNNSFIKHKVKHFVKGDSNCLTYQQSADGWATHVTCGEWISFQGYGTNNVILFDYDSNGEVDEIYRKSFEQGSSSEYILRNKYNTDIFKHADDKFSKTKKELLESEGTREKIRAQTEARNKSLTERIEKMLKEIQ